MNRLLALTMAVLFNCITGSVFGAVLGFSPVVGAVGMNCIATVIGGEVAQGALRAGVYKEVWTGEMVKYLRRGLEATWLDGIHMEMPSMMPSLPKQPMHSVPSRTRLRHQC